MEIDQLRQQEELYERHRGGTRKTQTALKHRAAAHGHRLRPVASQPGRHDLVTIKKLYRKKFAPACVPRALMISDSIYRSSTEGINDAFKHTLLWWKNAIAVVLTECWMRVHVDEVAKKVKKKENIFALSACIACKYLSRGPVRYERDPSVVVRDGGHRLGHIRNIRASEQQFSGGEKETAARGPRGEDEVMGAKKQKLDTDVKPTN